MQLLTLRTPHHWERWPRLCAGSRPRAVLERRKMASMSPPTKTSRTAPCRASRTSRARSGSRPARWIARSTASRTSAPRRARACSAWPRRSATAEPRRPLSAVAQAAADLGAAAPADRALLGLRCAKASAKPPRRSRPALHVDFRSYPRLGEGDIPLFEDALRDGTDGLIIAPGNPAALAPYLRKARATQHSGRVRRHRRARGVCA